MALSQFFWSLVQSPVAFVLLSHNEAMGGPQPAFSTAFPSALLGGLRCFTGADSSGACPEALWSPSPPPLPPIQLFLVALSLPAATGIGALLCAPPVFASTIYQLFSLPCTRLTSRVVPLFAFSSLLLNRVLATALYFCSARSVSTTLTLVCI